LYWCFSVSATLDFFMFMVQGFTVFALIICHIM
jgi:hypothetical protein